MRQPRHARSVPAFAPRSSLLNPTQAVLAHCKRTRGSRWQFLNFWQRSGRWSRQLQRSRLRQNGYNDYLNVPTLNTRMRAGYRLRSESSVGLPLRQVTSLEQHHASGEVIVNMELKTSPPLHIQGKQEPTPKSPRHSFLIASLIVLEALSFITAS